MEEDRKLDKLVSAIHRRYVEIDASTGHYDSEEDRAAFAADAFRVIEAAVYVGCVNADEWHPSEIISRCSNLRGGYSCWIDDIKGAILTAKLDIFPAPENLREQILSGIPALFVLIFALNQT
jgi:hypothetical protein